MIEVMREAGASLRDALRYSGSSWNLYYHEPKARVIPPDPFITRKVEELIHERPSYGTRRIAAQLSRELGMPINRKRVQRIFRTLGYTEPSKTKNEIIRAKDKAPKAARPHELWQTDLTYVPCGVDGWCYLFNVLDVFSREWAGKQFSPTATKDNAILSVENALVSHKELGPPHAEVEGRQRPAVHLEGVQGVDTGLRAEAGAHHVQDAGAERRHRVVPQDPEEGVRLAVRVRVLPGCGEGD